MRRTSSYMEHLVFSGNPDPVPVRGGMFRLLRNFRFQPAVGDGGLRDLYLRADIPGGELFCQYSHRRGDHRGYLRVHEGSAPGIFPCSDYGG